MYRPPSQRALLDQLEHIRMLHRLRWAQSGRITNEQIAAERFGKILAGNLRNGDHHPQPRTVLEMKRHFSMSADAVHRFFGCRIERIQPCDFRWNSARTHFIESYPFRSHSIDLPLRLEEHSLGRSASLRQMVQSWQRDVSMHEIARQSWYAHDVRYAQIGWEDSLSSPLPAGAIVAVEPVTASERRSPAPDTVYMIQFGNGYRCCHCSVQRGILRLIPERDGFFPLEFRADREARIIGKISRFALRLPLKKHRGAVHDLPEIKKKSPLVLPSNHRTLAGLFAAEKTRLHRFGRMGHEIIPLIEESLNIQLSERTIRRYTRPTPSLPRIDHLIGLSLYFAVPYSDVLRVLKLLSDDEPNLYSLEDLLRVQNLDDIPLLHPEMETPYPEQQWLQLISGLGGWSPLLSIWFPELAPLQDRIVRVSETEGLRGMGSFFPAGSYLLLRSGKGVTETDWYEDGTGWERPLYVLNRGQRLYCGHLHREDGSWHLLIESGQRREHIPLPTRELAELGLVIGAVMPL